MVDYDSITSKLLDVLIEDKEHNVALMVVKQDIKNILQEVYDAGYTTGYDAGVYDTEENNKKYI